MDTKLKTKLMKKLVLSMFCAASAIVAMSQDFTITGTVVDAGGNPVNNQMIWIYTDSTAFFNYYGTATTDVNGEYTHVVTNGAQVGPNIDYYVETNSNCNPNTTLQVMLSNNQGTVTSGVADFTTCINTTGNCASSFYVVDSSGYYYFFDTSTGAGPFTYSWDFGDGNTSTQQNPIHMYGSYGTYTVCLTITDGSCTNTSCQTIVYSSNGNGNCATSFYATNNGAGTYTFYEFSNMNASSWSWDFGDGNVGTGQNPTHTYALPGTYTVCLVASNLFCSDTFCSTINYTGQCQAEFYPYEDSTNNVIYLIDLSSGTGTMTYFWDFGDGNTSTLQYPTHVYANSGFYNVCLTITDNIACTSTYCDSVGFTLFGGPNSHHNGFTINVIPASSVGVDEVVEILTDMNVYPNPANENTTLEYNATEDGNHSIILTDITGKVVMNENYNAQKGNNRLNLNLNSIESGMYLITVADANGNQTTLRITKQ